MGGYLYPSFFVKLPDATAIKYSFAKGDYSSKYTKTLVFGEKKARKHGIDYFVGEKLINILFFFSV